MGTISTIQLRCDSERYNYVAHSLSFTIVHYRSLSQRSRSGNTLLVLTAEYFIDNQTCEKWYKNRSACLDCRLKLCIDERSGTGAKPKRAASRVSGAQRSDERESEKRAERNTERVERGNGAVSGDDK